MNRRHFLLVMGISALWCPLAQSAIKYSATNVTGQLALSGTTQVLTKARANFTRSLWSAAIEDPASADESTYPQFVRSRLHARSNRSAEMLSSEQRLSMLASFHALGLTVSTTFTGSGFDGLTHRDQKLANSGNQFNVEPPSPSIAVGNGYVLEGVNNAIQVYSSAGGAPLLPQALSSNQLFGLAPACILNTSYTPAKCYGPYGPYLTDMRVFYDQGINRWFVLQRGLDNDIYGNTLSSSHLYIAVSQTGDPTGTYNIYTMATTNSGNLGCPCFLDYPQVGADQYGIYVSANEYNTSYQQFVDVSILAISKKALAAGTGSPSTSRVLVKQASGYDFTIQPATTPPGTSYFTGNNGLEYFISSAMLASSGSNLAIWAMSNTGSLDTASPSLALSQIIVPTLTYIYPDLATQRPGTLTYGSTLVPPGTLALIDGADDRILSVTYSGAKLYATLQTEVTDDLGTSRVGGAYFIFSPTFRNGVLSSFTLGQGYLKVNGNHLLRPAVAVNSKGQGAIAFTLVGPDYYPSAAFVPLTALTTASSIQIAAPGFAPEDGFSGYPNNGYVNQGLARWGDYSTAVADSDGSVWMTTEYIPNALRTTSANWGTFLMRIVF